MYGKVYEVINSHCMNWESPMPRLLYMCPFMFPRAKLSQRNPIKYIVFMSLYIDVYILLILSCCYGLYFIKYCFIPNSVSKYGGCLFGVLLLPTIRLRDSLKLHQLNPLDFSSRNVYNVAYAPWWGCNYGDTRRSSSMFNNLFRQRLNQNSRYQMFRMVIKITELLSLLSQIYDEVQTDDQRLDYVSNYMVKMNHSAFPRY